MHIMKFTPLNQQLIFRLCSLVFCVISINLSGNYFSRILKETPGKWLRQVFDNQNIIFGSIVLI